MSYKFSVLSCKSDEKRIPSLSAAPEVAFSQIRAVRAGADFRNQSCEHQLDFANPAFHEFILFRHDESQVASKQTEVIEFSGRAKSHVEELPEFRVSGSSASLGYVCRHRERSSPHLARQSKSLIGRKGSRRSINTDGQVVALSPDIQFSKILHGGIPPKYLRKGFAACRDVPSVSTYHSKLRTYNSEESYRQC